MNLPVFLKGRNVLWNVAIVCSTIVALGANLAGLLAGITIVIPHLLYIPVIIAAYRYPKHIPGDVVVDMKSTAHKLREFYDTGRYGAPSRGL